jgi:hypothetical protein
MLARKAAEAASAASSPKKEASPVSSSAAKKEEPKKLASNPAPSPKKETKDEAPKKVLKEASKAKPAVVAVAAVPVAADDRLDEKRGSKKDEPSKSIDGKDSEEKKPTDGAPLDLKSLMTNVLIRDKDHILSRVLVDRILPTLVHSPQGVTSFTWLCEFFLGSGRVGRNFIFELFLPNESKTPALVSPALYYLKLALRNSAEAGALDAVHSVMSLLQSLFVLRSDVSRLRVIRNVHGEEENKLKAAIAFLYFSTDIADYVLNMNSAPLADFGYKLIKTFIEYDTITNKGNRTLARIMAGNDDFIKTLLTSCRDESATGSKANFALVERIFEDDGSQS